jgi:hypothetical protein
MKDEPKAFHPSSFILHPFGYNSYEETPHRAAARGNATT